MPDPGSVLSTFLIDGHEIVLRYPNVGDAAAMLDFINPVFLEETYVLMQGMQLTLAEEEDWLQARLEAMADGKEIRLIVEVEGQIVGTASVEQKSFAEDHIGVLGIIVAERFRGQGIGTRLFRAVIDEAIAHFEGLRIIELGVFSNNTNARRIYEREGFTEYGILPMGVRHRGQYVDHVLMYRNVAADD
jgi:RimJ/RimL family protein N-acetyltransferase